MGALAGIWSPGGGDLLHDIRNMTSRLALFEHDKAYCMQHKKMAIGFVHQRSRTLSEYVWNDDNLFLTFIGDIRNSDELRHSNGAGSAGMAELLAALYHKYSDRMAFKINGVFALFVYDKKTNTALLMNDRLGQTRLYYTKIGSTVLFASKAKALLAHRRVNSGVNTSMLLDLLLYRSPMSNESLFSGIHLLPPATIWRFTPEQESQSTYWWLEGHLAASHRERKRDILEQTRHLFNQAVERSLDANLSFSFGLTSGLDSRCILSAIGSDKNNVSCFTRGSENNPDVLIGEQLAKYRRLPFERKEVARVSSDTFRENLEKAVFLTEGLGNIESAVYLNSLVHCRENSSTDRQLTGTLGNQIMRIPLFFANKPAAFATLEDAVLGKIPAPHKPLIWMFNKAFKNVVRLYIGISDPAAFFNPGYLKIARERFHNMNHVLYSAADKIGYTSLGGKLHYLALRSLVQNCFPARNPMSEIYYRSPFIDIDFFEYVAKIPLSMKSELKTVMHKYIIEKNDPGLAQFPFFSKAKLGFFNKAAERRWRGALEPEIPRTILFELGHRMRTDLADFTREILLKNDLWSDQFLNKTFTRQMVKDHIDGKINATYAVSNLIVFELWHQQFSTYLGGTTKPVERDRIKKVDTVSLEYAF